MKIRRVLPTILLAGAIALLQAGQSPAEQLWQAARDGDLERAKALLEAGVDVDAKTQFDCTALYFAANNNRPEMIKLLAEAGADVDVRDNDYGYTAIGMAAWLGHEEAIGALLDAGVSRDDAIGGLFAAAALGHVEAAKLMVERLELPKGQLDAVAGQAQRNGQTAIVEMLVARGATRPEAPKPEAKAAEEKREAEKEATAKPPVEPADLRVLKPANWPEFRGAGRAGIADGQLPPLDFDLDSGRNVLWRTPIAGLGYSSPVVWGDRVYLTTAVSAETEQTIEDRGLGWIAAVPEDVSHTWELHAYELGSGKLLWKKVARTGKPRSQRHWKASQANPTVATDGKVVVASFGSEGLFAYDRKGKLLWKRDLGILNAGWYIDATFEWGFASSPIIFGDRVIVQADTHGDSFVAAYELKTGKQLWRTEREEIPSWGTPVVHDGEKRDELVLAATGAIVGYNPVDGKELWRVRGNSTITVASPLAQDGLIVVTGGYREPKPIYVIKPGGSGDITPGENAGNERVVWSSQTDGVYIVTPLLYRGVLYMLRGNGVLTAFDPASGEKHYRERVGGRYTASPVAADGKIYLTAEGGDVTVLAAGKEYRVLARSELDASTLATPAISDGVMLFRTVRELIGVGSAERRAEVETAMK